MGKQLTSASSGQISATHFCVGFAILHKNTPLQFTAVAGVIRLRKLSEQGCYQYPFNITPANQRVLVLSEFG